MSKLLDYKFFYTPFLYSIHTRFKSIEKLVSWVLIYIVPVLLLILMPNGFESELVFLSFIYLTGVYAAYEMGYIWNDAETIKNEKKPTLRLSREELRFYEESKYSIYFGRILLITVLGGGIYFFNKEISMYYLANIVIILALYAVYNNVRSLANLPLHFMLVLSRYVLPIIVLSQASWASAAWLILVFPLINLIERCSEKRFNLEFFSKFYLANKGRGRYVYYFIVSVLCVLFSAPTYISIVVLYMLLYRLLSFEVLAFVRK
ncbi:hypothetical protein KI701_10240 [Vibrio sp. D415a]|uniref:hypothetical protein n=1 Tax=Vibrio TaxID=662 RepID=UPI0025572D2F|nr:hypothetical protein [Vibrio sp. D421a]MDK9728571.1 hypothetical protein [Vibrio sp. D415a]MDK9745910.1 hypothetical protein [Vibrio sp. D409a]MDK9768645.1 hypothetical protein [Vibrio sp. D417a]